MVKMIKHETPLEHKFIVVKPETANPSDEPDAACVDLASADLRILAEAAFIAKASMLHNLLLTDGMKAHAAWFLAPSLKDLVAGSPYL
jgi:hypothetical protein